ncbi:MULTISPECIES: transposase [Cupriavidus]|uniref:transposase n=1 Tax=Cupriavidus TaxID=106589 RepID=UPI0034CEC250
MIGKTAPCHTSDQFVAFLSDVVASQRPKQEFHLICDIITSYKTDIVGTFLNKHRDIRLHYTPTYSSWLNQVEVQRSIATNSSGSVSMTRRTRINRCNSGLSRLTTPAYTCQAADRKKIYQ